MRILLTGASSFTGLAIAEQLRRAGHEVTAPLPRAAGAYDEGVRALRVAELPAFANVTPSSVAAAIVEACSRRSISFDEIGICDPSGLTGATFRTDLFRRR